MPQPASTVPAPATVPASDSTAFADRSAPDEHPARVISGWYGVLTIFVIAVVLGLIIWAASGADPQGAAATATGGANVHDHRQEGGRVGRATGRRVRGEGRG